MFCQNCGNKTKEEASFCTHCGVGLGSTSKKQKDSPLTIEEKSENKEISGAKATLYQAVVLGGFIISFIVGRYLGLSLLLFYAAFFIGQWFPKWYVKRKCTGYTPKRISTTLINWIVWSNILTWLLPPLGVMTGFAALEFGNLFPKDSKKYKTVAIIGITVSLLNAFGGVWLQQNA